MAITCTVTLDYPRPRPIQKNKHRGYAMISGNMVLSGDYDSGGFSDEDITTHFKSCKAIYVTPHFRGASNGEMIGWDQANSKLKIHMCSKMYASNGAGAGANNKLIQANDVVEISGTGAAAQFTLGEERGGATITNGYNATTPLHFVAYGTI